MQRNKFKDNCINCSREEMFLLKSFEAPIHVFDLRTYEIVYANDHSQKIFGDLTGKICWQVFNKSQQGPCPFCPNKKLLDTTGIPNGCLLWEMKNGLNDRWYENLDRALLWEDRRLVKLQVAWDITGRKAEQEKILQENNELRQIIEAIPVPMAVIDDQFRFTRMNQAIIDRCDNQKSDSVATTHCYQIFHRSNQPSPSCPHEKMLRQSKQSKKKISGLDCLGGIFDITIVPLTNQAGKVIKTLHLAQDISEHKRTEQNLTFAKSELEQRVAERTEKLRKANESLRKAVRRYQKAMEQLQMQAKEIEEANIALKVLMKNSNQAEEELEERMVTNIKGLLIPHLDILEKKIHDEKIRSYLQHIRDNIKNISSSFSQKLSSKIFGLTPRELHVAALIKEGKSSKEIAQDLHLSVSTVEVFRGSIRRKLDITCKKVNLRSYLLSQFP